MLKPAADPEQERPWPFLETEAEDDSIRKAGAHPTAALLPCSEAGKARRAQSRRQSL